MTIELTDDEFGNLIFTLGIAAGALAKQSDMRGVSRVFRLANAINRNNPNWTPYEIPPEPPEAA